MAALGIAILLLASPNPLRACPTCGCGDPTVLLMGTAQPYRGFWRLGTETRYTRMTVGTPGVNSQKETEQRVSLLATYAPAPRLFLSLVAPIVRRELTSINGGQVSATAPGDLELHSRIYLARGGVPGRWSALGLATRITAPTAGRQINGAGEPLDIDVQPGFGGWIGSAGLWASHAPGRWSFYASTVLQSSTRGWEEHRAGRAWLNSASVRYRLSRTLAGSVGTDTRSASKDTYADVPDATTGGFSAFLSPTLTLSPTAALVIDVGAQLPLSQPAMPHHRDNSVVTLSVTYSN